MKINRLEIPEGYKGLHAAQMTTLSDVVLIAGPNGGGKSRILQAIRDNCSRPGPGGESLGILRDQLAKYRASLAQNEVNLQAIADNDHQASRAQMEFQRNQHLISELVDRLKGTPSIDPDPTTPPLLVDLTTVDAIFQDCGAISASSWGQAIASVALQLSMQHAIQFGPGAIYAILANASLTTPTMTETEREEHRSRLEQLNSLTQSILGTTFALRNFTEGPTIFGHSLGSANLLSSGQRILLAVVYILFFQQAADKDVVILWDEPENHLHPEAVIKILDSLRLACPRAQIWIATHSIHVLAHFQEHGIWFASAGKIARGGRVAEKVLTSLIGEESQLDKLTEFLAQPAQRAIRLFSTQCLVPPGTIDTLPGDPQTTQIFNYLSDDSRDSLDVLDFGAGKGRLLTELVAHNGGLDRVNYFAYDHEPSNSDRIAINGHLDDRYGADNGRYATGPLPSALDHWSSKFDVVVMCNVLHEVPPEEWELLFGQDGALSKTLKDDGILLIVEDYVLAAGERAHTYGFLLLDEDDLRKLFKSSAHEAKTFLHTKPSYSNRLKAHAISRAALLKMTESTIMDALESLRDRSFNKARSLHASDAAESSAGHALAVAAHQHLNALLAIDALRARTTFDATN